MLYENNFLAFILEKSFFMIYVKKRNQKPITQDLLNLLTLEFKFVWDMKDV